MSASWVIHMVNYLLQVPIGQLSGGAGRAISPAVQGSLFVVLLFLVVTTLWFFFHRLEKHHLREKQQLAAENLQLRKKIGSLTEKNREINQLLIEKMKETDTWNRKKEEKYQEAVRKFEEKEKLHNSFFKELIHEMRTPLSLILGSISEIVRKNTLQGDVSAQLLSAYRNALALQDVSLQLRSARLGEDVANHLRVARYDMVELTRQICDLFIDWIAMNNVDFRINTQFPALWIWCDRRKVEFALRILLSNAMKNTFMYGRILIDLSVILSEDKQKCCLLSILDEGLGETENDRPGLKLIADMAATTGLAFCKGDTPAEGGSCYTLSIPLGKRYLLDREAEFVEPDGDLLCFNEQQKEEIAELIRVIPRKINTGKKLLIVDDSDQIRWFLKHVFYQEYEIIEAGNGQEGIELAHREHPDILLCDVMMPVKDGLAVCREIKSDPATCHIPVIMLTAKVESEDIIAGIECGADDYMTKPFDMSILRSKIGSVLKRQEEMKRYRRQQLAEPSPAPAHSSAETDGKAAGSAESLPESQSQQEEHPTSPPPATSPTPGSLFMEAVIKTIEQHIDDPGFEAKVLADSLHISLPTLYRKIKLYSDYSVLEITRTVRLKKAAELICQQRYSIQEVSERVGFNDPATFRKRFTEQYGVTPSAYLSTVVKHG